VGRPLTQAALNAAYARCREVYGSLGRLALYADQ
jgi:hypothetical protein